MRRPYQRSIKGVGHGFVVLRNFKMDNLETFNQAPDQFLAMCEHYSFHTPQRIYRRSDGEWATAMRGVIVDPSAHELVAELEYISQQ